VLAAASASERAAWPLVARHPLTGEPVLRCAEPSTHETPGARRLAELSRRFYDPAFCYAHSWREGDVLVADNHALLHGRAPSALDGRRRVTRVDVM
jgi:alpha-ketoglutarate-dependent taurine dioxygenase